MRRPLIRQGEGPAAAYERQQREADQLKQKLDRIARETDVDEPVRLRRGATSGGDPRRLRGLPAIGRTVRGAIDGTSPHHDAKL